jgi:hypothetical protein
MPGRNDLCPCGSGKKYKKCCLATGAALPELVRESTTTIPRNPLPVLRGELAKQPTRQPTPQQVYWQQFRAKDRDAQMATFREEMESPDFDSDSAFEFLGFLYDERPDDEALDRFADLVQGLRQRHPDLYQDNSHFFLSWLMQDALAKGDFANLADWGRELATRTNSDIDVVNRVLDRLAYHGQLALLVEMHRIAWPDVKTEVNIVPWGVEEFCRRAMDYEVFSYLEEAPAPDPGDPVLLERLRFYNPHLYPRRLAEFLAFLRPSHFRSWVLSDFQMQVSSSQEGYRFDEDDDQDYGDEEEDDEAEEGATTRPSPTVKRSLRSLTSAGTTSICLASISSVICTPKKEFREPEVSWCAGTWYATSRSDLTSSWNHGRVCSRQ